MSGAIRIPDTLSPVAKLALGVSGGATSARLDQSVLTPGALLGWVVIDAYTTNCEIRRINSVSGVTVGWSSGLSLSHSAGAAMLVVHEAWTNVKWFGATGDGTTDDTTALNNAWTRRIVGGTFYVPFGTYSVSDTVAWANGGNFESIVCDRNALIVDRAVSFAGKAVVSLSGCSSMDVHNLNINCRNATTPPVVGLMLCRNAGNTGAGGMTFYGVTVQGVYSGASFYNHAGETFLGIDCFFQSETINPPYYDTYTDALGVSGRGAGSNTRKTWIRSFFLNYSGIAGGHAVVFNTPVSEHAYHDCYTFVPAQGHAFHVQGSSTMLSMHWDGHRSEGTNHANSRFLFIATTVTASFVRTFNIQWTVVSDWVYEIQGSIGSSDLWADNAGVATGQLLVTTATGAVRDCDIHLGIVPSTNQIVCEANANIEFCRIFTAKASGVYPITGAGTYNLAAKQDNIIIVQAGYLARSYFAVESSKFSQFADADATPSVLANSRFEVINSGATNVTTFDDPSPGQRLTLVFRNGNTTLKQGATLKLQGTVDYNPTNGSVCELVYDDNQTCWREVGRVVA